MLSIEQLRCIRHMSIVEMIDRKLVKWSKIQHHVDTTQPLAYEIHVTVSTVDWNLTNFEDCCNQIGVTPIVLDLHKTSSNQSIVDVMTSSTVYGTDTTAFCEMDRVSSHLEDHGFDVIRTKIETVPWHPRAPITNVDIKPHDYYEIHLKFILSESQSVQLRHEVKHDVDLFGQIHLSSNKFKQLTDDQFILMGTIRKYGVTLSQFETVVGDVLSKLESKYTISTKRHIEYAMYDSNHTHDNLWLNTSN